MGDGDVLCDLQPAARVRRAALLPEGARRGTETARGGAAAATERLLVRCGGVW